MNVKAERIDQLIQIINRNLLLIFSGQTEGKNEMHDQRFLIPFEIKIFSAFLQALHLSNFEDCIG
jgi:hypothetical protein